MFFSPSYFSIHSGLTIPHLPMILSACYLNAFATKDSKSELPHMDGKSNVWQLRFVIMKKLFLPEVNVEGYGDAQDDDGVNDIPFVPAGTGGGNLLGSGGAKDKALNLLLLGSLGEQ